MHLTVSRYFTPSGRCIQRDYSDSEDYEDDFAARFQSGELQDPTKTKLADTTEYYTAGGRVVYGAGGISPDIFVPLDTFLFSTYYLQLRQKIAPFVFRYFETNKEALEEWVKESAFVDNFEVTDKLFNEFLAYAEKDEALSKRNEKILSKTEPDLRQGLKGRIGKHLFDQSTFLKILNERSPMIGEALNWINSEEKLVELVD